MSSRSASRHNPARQPKPLLIVGLAALAAILLGGVWFVVSALGNSKSEVSVAEAVALRDRGALFLDVRTADEWNSAHVAGSTLIPLDELDRRASELPRDRDIVVICASGARSQVGRGILLNKGFTKVSVMTGGLLEWKAQGYPMVAGP